MTEFKLVPVVPTEAMIEAAQNSGVHPVDAARSWVSMLAAAPAHDGEVVYQACSLGVGCEEAGVCYAMANGDSGKCGKNRGNL